MVGLSLHFLLAKSNFPSEADSYGGVLINGVHNWAGQQNIALKVRIHCGCLSFLCRITNCSPKNFYDSLVESRFWQLAFRGGGLINFMTYYNMEGRDSQHFAYALQMHKDNSVSCDWWWDTNWLLARPTVFPRLDPLPELLPIIPKAPVDWSSAICRVLRIPELLDDILDYIVALPEQDVLAAEIMVSARDGHSDSLDQLVKTIFNLLQVEKYLYAYILEQRQDLFLRLARHHAWMLPITTFDLQSWKRVNEPIQFMRRQLTRDWRRYLLTFLRRDDLHVKNRFRMYRMALQCTRGKAATSENEKWSVGELGYVPGIAEDAVGCVWNWENQCLLDGAY